MGIATVYPKPNSKDKVATLTVGDCRIRQGFVVKRGFTVTSNRTSRLA